MSLTDGKQGGKLFCDLGAGNIVPTWWYSAIKAGGDKPDLVAITLLSELWFLYRKRGVEEYNEGYDYFERKFYFSKSQLQDATRRLHDNGIIERSFRSIKINRGLYPNVLHIKLNVDKLLQLRREHDHNFSDSDDGEVSSMQVAQNLQQSYRENSDEHIGNEEKAIRNNRSREANFCKVYNFNSFYPLSDEDVCMLQTTSGREFGTRAVNEILKSLAGKYPAYQFPSKEAFMSYMTKALRHEMRDAARVNNETFRINANSKTDSAERYLQIIENSLETSKYAQLRRKIAGVLEKQSAYMFLRAFRNVEIEGDRLFLVLTRESQLTEFEASRVISETKAVYGGWYEIIIRNTGFGQNKKQSCSKSRQKQLSAQNSLEAICDSEENTPDMWRVIRKSLISSIGRDGEAIDRAWLSKLEHKTDVENRKILLSLASSLAVEWVRERYLQLIEQVNRAFNFQVEVVS